MFPDLEGHVVDADQTRLVALRLARQFPPLWFFGPTRSAWRLRTRSRDP